MRAAFIADQGKPLVVEEVSPLPPGPDDVVVRIGAAGICHTDLTVASGPCPPAILGHEGVGIVDWVGSEVRALKVGDRVIGSTIPRCGTCLACLRGQPYICDTAASFGPPRARRSDGTELLTKNGLGTFAELMTVPERSAVKVDSQLSDAELALVGCALTTGVGAVLNTARVTAGSTVLVIGLGGVGQAVVQGARVAGAGRVIVADPIQHKRDMALKLGATDVVDPSQVDTVAAVRELTEGRLADFAFDTAGFGATVRQAYTAVRRGGTAVVIGIGDLSQDLPIPGTLVVEGKTLCGCIYGSVDVARDVPTLVRMIETGELDASSLISRTITLDEINEGFRALEAGEVLRTVII
jgi:S-(hydroxymethyl)glutathione dehydrogenase/alcohol dehydrogenase